MFTYFIREEEEKNDGWLEKALCYIGITLKEWYVNIIVRKAGQEGKEFREFIVMD